MGHRKGRASGQEALQSAVRGNDKNTVPDSAHGALAVTNYRAECPCCGHATLDITRKLGRDGRPTVLIKCWNCQAGLDDVHAATGIPKWQLLGWPPPAELGPPVARSRSAAGRKPEQPPIALVPVWHEHLLHSPRARDALVYLTQRRGIGLLTVHEYQLGYGSRSGRPHAFMFPVYEERGDLGAVKERYWPDLWTPGGSGKPVKTRNSPGESHLYPLSALADDPHAIAVCEGEFDALLLNQAGIPAITSTAGTSWRPEWDRHVAGRYCAVLYDAGASSYEVAEQRAADFRNAGARDAWPVDFTFAGFREGDDVGDWFGREGWSGGELVAFINESRRWYLREAGRR